VVRVCGPRLHAGLDVTVALAVATAPAVAALRPDVAGIVVVEVAALAWLRMATLTRYRRPVATDEGPAVRDRSAAVGRTAAVGRGSVVARRLGILAGRSTRRLPEAQQKLAGGARQAGRHAGRLRRSWRQTAC